MGFSLQVSAVRALFIEGVGFFLLILTILVEDGPAGIHGGRESQTGTLLTS